MTGSTSKIHAMTTSLQKLVIVLFTCLFYSTMLAAPIAERHKEFPTYFAHANGLSIAYQDFGDPNDPAVVLIMGLGAQLIHWQDDFVLALAAAGYRVIRFDNRDIGWSEKLHQAGSPGFITGLRFKLGLSLGAPYHLSDMAADAIGLLDHLDIQEAHVAGISMGGMIAQIMTANYPDRILSLTSIMSSSGKKGLPEGTVQIQMRERDGLTREQILDDMVAASKAIYAAESKLDDEVWRARAIRGYDRNHYDKGFARQYWAILDSGDRLDLLNSITQPSLVIHGALDPLLPLPHGVNTAENIPNSKFIVLNDMGHYMDKEHHARVLSAMFDIMKMAD